MGLDDVLTLFCAVAGSAEKAAQRAPSVLVVRKNTVRPAQLPVVRTKHLALRRAPSVVVRENTAPRAVRR